MGNAVEDNLTGRCLGLLNRILPRVTIKENVQFRNLGNPAPIHLTVELNCEFHSHSLAPDKARSGAGPTVPCDGV